MPVVNSDLNPRARALATALREIRKRYGVTSRELSIRMGHSHAFVSHWETGRRIPGPAQVAALLGKLPITGDERAHLMFLAEAAAEPGWPGAGLAALHAHVFRAIDCERAADEIVEWAPTTIPDLLQIPEYIRAQIPPGTASYAETEARVLISAGRREIVGRAIDPIRYTALIGEAALREPIGSPRIMAEALTDLAESARRTNIALYVVPARIGWHPGLTGAFTIYHFADSPETLYFPHHATGVFLLDRPAVTQHRHAVETLRAKALSKQQSIDYLLATAHRWGGNR